MTAAKRSYPASLYIEIPPSDERYFDALGRFVHEFSRAEATIYGVLRHYARLSDRVAAALLSGVRASDVMGRLTRLHNAGVVDAADWLDLKAVFQQFKIINDTRNDILHYGADTMADGSRAVTTALKSIRAEDTRNFPISKEILDDMRADLRKIIIHLRLRHRGLPQLRAKHPEFDALLLAPWRYDRQVK